MTTILHRAALALVAVRVLLDAGAGWLALAPLGLMAVRFHPLLALAGGVFGLAAGADAAYYGEGMTGFASLAAGVTLLGLAVHGWWQGRRRALTAVGAIALSVLVLLPLGYGYVTGQVGRKDGLTGVTFKSVDGLTLHGRYTPSRNGAAVIVLGRKPEHARMLARHGYGVLEVDRRGEGHSKGRPNSWGWGAERDAEGAIAYLKRRGVDRVGGLGFSVGGEILLTTRGLDAVVSEGAGSRSHREALSAFARAQFAVRDVAVTIATGRTPPPGLDGRVARSKTPTLLIAAPNTPNLERLNRRYAEGSDATLWEIPESAHTRGLQARPAEYERRVVGFFDRVLNDERPRLSPRAPAR